MISNQAASSANMTGNLFQIFNLPKSGNSSYLFSDIIKVIGAESEAESSNNITSSFFADSSKSLIDSNKLIGLLKDINTSGISENAGEDLTGKYYITDIELTEFINKLGLEGSAEAAKLSSEIAVEVTPAFLNKLSALLNSSKPQVHKNIFATIAPEENPEKINISDGEESDEAEGNEKIQVVFKKVSPESDVIAAPQQFAFNAEQNTTVGTGETEVEGGFLTGSNVNKIVLGGSKYEFFADTSSGKSQGAQVLSGGVQPQGNTGTPVVNQDNLISQNIQSSQNNSGFAEVLAEMNAAAETEETAEIPEAVKTFKSDGSFFSQELKAEIETPVVKAQADTKNAAGNTNVNTQAANQPVNPEIIESEKTLSEKISAVAPENTEGSIAKPAESTGKVTAHTTEPKPEAQKAVTGQKNKSAGISSVQSEFTNDTESEKTAGSTLPRNTDIKSAADGKEKVNVPVNKEQNTIETEPVKTPETNNGNIKASLKESFKTSDEPGNQGNVKIQHESEIPGKRNEPVKNNTVQASVEYLPEVETETEFSSSFHFSTRFENEFMKNKSGMNQNRYNQVNTDNSNIYEITFEKNRPENSYYGEKVLPQDFDTSDYETLSSGIFAGKTSDAFKESKPVEKTDAATEKNTFRFNEAVEESDHSESGSQQTSQGSGHSSSNESNSKSSYKPSNDVAFSDHLQHRTNGVNEAALPKTVKSYTSVFKEVDAAHLVDEIKNICVKGEKSNITLKLSPEHLGAVKLSIDIKDSVMSTSIEVENESVRQVVQNNIETLRQTLQANGIQLSSFSVTLSNQHEQKSSGKSGNKKEKQQENEGIKLKTEEKTVRTKKLGYNTYEYLA